MMNSKVEDIFVFLVWQRTRAGPMRKFTVISDMHGESKTTHGWMRRRCRLQAILLRCFFIQIDVSVHWIKQPRLDQNKFIKWQCGYEMNSIFSSYCYRCNSFFSSSATELNFLGNVPDSSQLIVILNWRSRAVFRLYLENFLERK